MLRAGEDLSPPETSRRASRPGPWSLVLAMVVLAVAVTGALMWLRGGVSDAEDAGQVVAGTSPVAEIPPGQRTEPVDVSGTDLDGNPLSLADFRGDVVVVNVWGSWCVPCREEAPMLSALSEELAGRGVSFVGIDVRDNVTAAKAFENRYGITYPSFDDPQARAVLAFQGTVPVQAVPSTIVLDRQGRVAARIVGVAEESTLRALVDTALAEPVTGATP